MDKTKEYIIAKNELLTAKIKDCQQFFIKNGFLLEAAYYELLNKNLYVAKKFFEKIQDSDIRAHWGNFLASMAEGKIKDYPTYMELRNFYEVDLQLFFTYYLGDYIENICKFSDWLFNINPEIYKYTGRVFLKNKFEDIGLYFLDKAKENYFNDPELHYLLAEYNTNNNNYDNARINVENCLQILPNYYPAMKIKRTLDALLKES